MWLQPSFSICLCLGFYNRKMGIIIAPPLQGCCGDETLHTVFRCLKHWEQYLEHSKHSHTVADCFIIAFSCLSNLSSLAGFFGGFVSQERRNRDRPVSSPLQANPSCCRLSLPVYCDPRELSPSCSCDGSSFSGTILFTHISVYPLCLTSIERNIYLHFANRYMHNFFKRPTYVKLTITTHSPTTEPNMGEQKAVLLSSQLSQNVGGTQETVFIFLNRSPLNSHLFLSYNHRGVALKENPLR